MPSRLLRAVVLATLPCVAAWWSGADEHPAMFVRGRVAVANPQVSTRIHQSVVGVQVRPRDASQSPDGDSCLPLTLGAAGGCQVGITYNVTVQLSGVDGDLQPSSMSSIVLESRMITEEVAVEEHLLDFDLPPLPLGQYQLTTVVLDTRRLPSDPVALLSK